MSIAIRTGPQDAGQILAYLNGLVNDLNTSFAAVTASQRQLLVAPLSYYVRTDGSDSNGGLANTAAGAKRTIQAAVNAAYALDWNSQPITINVADGSYTAGAAFVGMPPGATRAIPITVQGNIADPTAVVITATDAHCFSAIDGAFPYITGFKLSTTGSGDCIVANNAMIIFGAINFGTAAAFHLEATDHALILNNGGYTISDGAVAHIHSNNGSYVQNLSGVCTLDKPGGTIAFSSYFVGIASAQVQRVAFTYDITATTTVTGQKFLIHQNGVLTAAAYASTDFPGSAAGVVNSGGIFTGTDGSLQRVAGFAFASLPAAPAAGSFTYCTNGRKNAEGAGLGTGVPVFADSTNGWISYCSGLPVTA